jgi:hypothetical protein
MSRLPALLFAAVLFLAVGCNPTSPAPPKDAPAPSHTDTSGMSDGSPSIQDSANGPAYISTGDLLLHAPSTWKPKLTIAKCWAADVEPDGTCLKPYEIVDTVGNNVTTNGANQLWTGLSTAGLATPWNTTNTQLAVGDSSAAFAAAQTDLQAVAGTKLNAADVTSCTNATPVVCAGTYSPTPLVGQVVALSGFSGAGAAVLNNTWELSAASASSITLLNSASPGAITVTGGLIKPINYYRQIASGAGSAVVSTNQIVYVAVVATANANHAWQEWGMTTGAAATNKLTQPPPFLLNRAVTNLGTKTSASAWTATLTLSISEILLSNLTSGLMAGLAGAL